VNHLKKKSVAIKLSKEAYFVVKLLEE